jgi:hypothetical protein
LTRPDGFGSEGRLLLQQLTYGLLDDVITDVIGCVRDSPGLSDLRFLLDDRPVARCKVVVGEGGGGV